ncbi:MAG: SDR family NAD(P)-dependent oxidoreductase [Rickettsiales bacterium]
MQNNDLILVIGATSSLAQALCRTLAARGHPLVLCGRDESELELLAGDLQTRYGIHCNVIINDATEDSFSAGGTIAEAGDFRHVVITMGDMGNDQLDDLNNMAITAMLNYLAPAQLASVAASRLAQRNGGSVTIISSVAGDRGRASNYPYGAAKAALSAFASGLRNRYAKSNVHVMTVKPGFVDTPMTWGMDSPLIASREMVAKKIVDAMNKQKDVLYVPWFWRFIMLVICAIPERIFKKLSL